MYFQATEYVLWSLSYTVWIRLEFLLIYNQAGPSKKEIIAKRSNFQRKIWTNLERPKWVAAQKLLLIFYFWFSFFFLLRGTFIHPRQPPKSFGPFGPSWKCYKIHVFFTLIPFSSFSSSSGPPQKISSDTLASLMLPQNDFNKYFWHI